MKKLRWQLLIVLVALIAIGILLAGQQNKLEIVNPLPVDEPQSGGEYIEALVGQLRRLNPVLDYYNQVDRDVDRLIFSSLIKFDHRGLPQGDLAETWGISQNGEHIISPSAGCGLADGEL
jgi:peptide/nickel transport system substrate-binding protein